MTLALTLSVQMRIALVHDTQSASIAGDLNYAGDLFLFVHVFLRSGDASTAALYFASKARLEQSFEHVSDRGRRFGPWQKEHARPIGAGVGAAPKSCE